MDGDKKNSAQSGDPQPLAPGVTITPGTTSGASVNEPAVIPPHEPTQTPISPSEPVPSQLPKDVGETEGNFYHQTDLPAFDQNSPTPAYPTGHEQGSTSEVSWTASEFIAHQKSTNWYLALFGIAVVVMIAVWFLTKDVFSTIVVALAVGVLAAYGSRQPRELHYVVDNNGITIGQKAYPYSLFRSFSVVDEGAFSSLELMPLKHLSPPITIYYGPEDETAITEAVALHLPFEHRERDAIEHLMRRIRF